MKNKFALFLLFLCSPAIIMAMWEKTNTKHLQHTSQNAQWPTTTDQRNENSSSRTEELLNQLANKDILIHRQYTNITDLEIKNKKLLSENFLLKEN